MVDESCLINYLVRRVTHPQPLTLQSNVMTNYVKVNANIQYLLQHYNVHVYCVHVRSSLLKVKVCTK